MRKLKKLVMCVLLPLSALLLMGHGQVELPKPDETPALPPTSEVQEQPVTLEDIRTATYVDVPADSQNYDTVCYVSYHGILQGVGSGRFDLYSPVDRATVVTVLYRMSGEEAPAAGGYFPDVPTDSWYAEAVAWAVEAEITTGTAEGTFSPLEPVTRGQLAVFLARYFAYCGNIADSTDHLEAYTDGADVPTYAVPAMSWVLENGLYRTIVADTILPDMPVSRVQLAQILLGSHSLSGDALAGEIFSALPDKAVAEENAEWNDAVQSIVRNVSKKYGAVGRSVAEQLERTRWAYPGADGSCFAGGLTISAQDLAKLVALLVQDGRYEGVQLLPAAAVAEMERYDTRAVSGSSCQGLALRYQKNSYGRQGVYFHTGSAYGVYNCLSYDPVTGDGVVVLTSGASGKKNDAGIYKICAEISDQIYHLMAQ